MVFQESMENIKKSVAERLKAFNLGHLDYKVENEYDCFVYIRFQKDVANQYRDEIAECFTKFRTNEVRWSGNRFPDRVRGEDTGDIELQIFLKHCKKKDAADDAYWDLQEKLSTAGTPEYEAKKKREREIRIKYSHEYLIPIPPPPKNVSDQIYLTMAYEYYDMIESGEKVTEFRRYTENWVKRLLSHPLKTVKFQRGYGGPGRPKPKQMVWTIKNIDLYNSMTRECAVPGKEPAGFIPDFIAIDLGERIDKKE